MLLLMGSGAVFGVLLNLFVPGPMWVHAVPGYAFCALMMNIVAADMTPMLSAAILPVPLGTREWVYPVAVIVLVSLVCLGQIALEHAGLREPLDCHPFRLPKDQAFTSWMKRLAVFAAISAPAYFLNQPFFAAPPLLVAYTELTRPGFTLRLRPPEGLVRPCGRCHDRLACPCCRRGRSASARACPCLRGPHPHLERPQALASSCGSRAAACLPRPLPWTSHAWPRGCGRRCRLGRCGCLGIRWHPSLPRDARGARHRGACIGAGRDLHIRHSWHARLPEGPSCNDCMTGMALSEDMFPFSSLECYCSSVSFRAGCNSPLVVTEHACSQVRAPRRKERLIW